VSIISTSMLPIDQWSTIFVFEYYDLAISVTSRSLMYRFLIPESYSVNSLETQSEP
jgi:hypothetical protein